MAERAALQARDAMSAMRERVAVAVEGRLSQGFVEQTVEHSAARRGLADAPWCWTCLPARANRRPG